LVKNQLICSWQKGVRGQIVCERGTCNCERNSEEKKKRFHGRLTTMAQSRGSGGEKEPKLRGGDTRQKRDKKKDRR